MLQDRLWLVRQWLAVVNDEERTRHLAWAEIEDTWADQAVYTDAFFRHQGYECWAHVAGSERVAETGGHQPYHHVRTWNGSDMSGPRGAVRNWEAASALPAGQGPAGAGARHTLTLATPWWVARRTSLCTAPKHTANGPTTVLVQSK